MIDRRVNILCVHQGGELYGSDRSFLQAVQALRANWTHASIKVVLAADGPLRALLADSVDTVIVRDLAVLRLADPVSTAFRCTIGLPWYVGMAIRDIARSDLIYINTTVIADYMIAARTASAKIVIHAREIPKPKAMGVIRALVRASGAHVIFNSEATLRALALPPQQSQAVIHNGVDSVVDIPSLHLPVAFDSSRPLKLAMLGRISDWKGQDLLIDALTILSPAERKQLKVRIVGSTFRDALEPLEALKVRIAQAKLTDVVTLEPFRDDPSEVYRWSDICVVPSRLPEPFGRVAIEAMATGRAVIAASHGGLVEIVEDGRSGWLVAPNDANSLASSIRQALGAPALVEARGEAALRRFTDHFSSATMSARLRTVLHSWVPKLGPY